ncbi:MAG: ATP-binding protein [Pseudomonadota bacterium]
MKPRPLGAFARLAAIFALGLLMIQLFLVWLYIRDRSEGDEPGYRFPLPGRVIAMADMMEAAQDPRPVLIALNGPDLLVSLVDDPVGAFAPEEDRLPAIDRIFDEYRAQLSGRDVAVYVAVPEEIVEQDIRIGDRSIWSRFPMRIAIDLDRGGALVVESRDDLLTQVYSVPIGWWSGIFASIAALIVLFALHVETRPIVRLASAADAFGRDGEPRHVKPTGSRDMRSLIATFNDMQTGLEDLLTRRRVMLGALGHDLRTHLTRLSLKLEDTGIGQERGLARNIAQMERILENCLDLARDEAPVNKETLELNAFVGAMLEDHTQIPIQFEPMDEVYAEADPAALERILINLMENAQKFATEAEVRVSDGPPTVTVCDNGPGIAEADLERMLEPFTVADEARTQGQAGSGLGLAISRMLAEAQGGTLTLRLRDGVGGLCASLVLPDERSMSGTHR